jgi:secondary thiamine-phosphate synthase enzyme
MVSVHKLLSLSSSERRQLIDITAEVENFVRGTAIRNGVCVISAPHATAAIIANENERGLMRDILNKINDLFPVSSKYAHNAIDDNADSHLAASFLGHSRTFSVIDRRMIRGTWQSIFLVELDGPRSRREVHLHVIGDD